MSLDPNDPDTNRRNLVVLSMAIAMFNWADARLPDNVVRFQFVSADVHRPDVLVYAIWFLLAWFLIRYYQTHRGYIAEQFHYGTQQFEHPWKGEFYLSHRPDLVDEGHCGIGHKAFCVNEGRLSIVYQGKKRQKARNGETSRPFTGEEQTVPITGPYGWLTKALLVGEISFTTPAFTSSVVPYLMPYVAVGSALLS